MKTKARHIVGKCVVRIDVPTRSKADFVFETLSRIAQQRLPELIEEVLVGMGLPAEQYYRIDRLELDLGELPEQQFEAAFVKAFLSAMQRQLSAGGTAIPEADPAKNTYELWLHYIKTGAFPWWADAERRQWTLGRLFETALAEMPPGSVAALRSVLARQQVRRRLAWQLDTAGMARLLQHLIPEAPVQGLAALWAALEKPAEKALEHWRRQLLDLILTQLSATAVSPQILEERLHDLWPVAPGLQAVLGKVIEQLPEADKLPGLVRGTSPARDDMALEQWLDKGVLPEGYTLAMLEKNVVAALARTPDLLLRRLSPGVWTRVRAAFGPTTLEMLVQRRLGMSAPELSAFFAQHPEVTLERVLDCLSESAAAPLDRVDLEIRFSEKTPTPEAALWRYLEKGIAPEESDLKTLEKTFLDLLHRTADLLLRRLSPGGWARVRAAFGRATLETLVQRRLGMSAGELSAFGAQYPEVTLERVLDWLSESAAAPMDRLDLEMHFLEKTPTPEAALWLYLEKGIAPAESELKTLEKTFLELLHHTPDLLLRRLSPGVWARIRAAFSPATLEMLVQRRLGMSAPELSAFFAQYPEVTLDRVLDWLSESVAAPMDRLDLEMYFLEKTPTPEAALWWYLEKGVLPAESDQKTLEKTFLELLSLTPDLLLRRLSSGVWTRVRAAFGPATLEMLVQRRLGMSAPELSAFFTQHPEVTLERVMDWLSESRAAPMGRLDLEMHFLEKTPTPEAALWRYLEKGILPEESDQKTLEKTFLELLSLTPDLLLRRLSSGVWSRVRAAFGPTTLEMLVQRRLGMSAPELSAFFAQHPEVTLERVLDWLSESRAAPLDRLDLEMYFLEKTPTPEAALWRYLEKGIAPAESDQKTLEKTFLELLNHTPELLLRRLSPGVWARVRAAFGRATLEMLVQRRLGIPARELTAFFTQYPEVTLDRVLDWLSESVAAPMDRVDLEIRFSEKTPTPEAALWLYLEKGVLPEESDLKTLEKTFLELLHHTPDLLLRRLTPGVWARVRAAFSPTTLEMLVQRRLGMSAPELSAFFTQYPEVTLDRVLDWLSESAAAPLDRLDLEMYFLEKTPTPEAALWWYLEKGVLPEESDVPALEKTFLDLLHRTPDLLLRRLSPGVWTRVRAAFGPATLETLVQRRLGMSAGELSAFFTQHPEVTLEQVLDWLSESAAAPMGRLDLEMHFLEKTPTPEAAMWLYLEKGIAPAEGDQKTLEKTFLEVLNHTPDLLLRRLSPGVWTRVRAAFGPATLAMLVQRRLGMSAGELSAFFTQYPEVTLERVLDWLSESAAAPMDRLDLEMYFLEKTPTPEAALWLYLEKGVLLEESDQKTLEKTFSEVLNHTPDLLLRRLSSGVWTRVRAAFSPATLEMLVQRRLGMSAGELSAFFTQYPEVTLERVLDWLSESAAAPLDRVDLEIHFLAKTPTPEAALWLYLEKGILPAESEIKTLEKTFLDLLLTPDLLLRRLTPGGWARVRAAFSPATLEMLVQRRLGIPARELSAFFTQHPEVTLERVLDWLSESAAAPMDRLDLEIHFLEKKPTLEAALWLYLEKGILPAESEIKTLEKTFLDLLSLTPDLLIRRLSPGGWARVRAAFGPATLQTLVQRRLGMSAPEQTAFFTQYPEVTLARVLDWLSESAAAPMDRLDLEIHFLEKTPTPEAALWRYLEKGVLPEESDQKTLEKTFLELLNHTPDLLLRRLSPGVWARIRAAFGPATLEMLVQRRLGMSAGELSAFWAQYPEVTLERVLDWLSESAAAPLDRLDLEIRFLEKTPTPEAVLWLYLEKGIAPAESEIKTLEKTFLELLNHTPDLLLRRLSPGVWTRIRAAFSPATLEMLVQWRLGMGAGELTAFFTQHPEVTLERVLDWLSESAAGPMDRLDLEMHFLANTPTPEAALWRYLEKGILPAESEIKTLEKTFLDLLRRMPDLLLRRLSPGGWARVRAAFGPATLEMLVQRRLGMSAPELSAFFAQHPEVTLEQVMDWLSEQDPLSVLDIQQWRTADTPPPGPNQTQENILLRWLQTGALPVDAPSDVSLEKILRIVVQEQPGVLLQALENSGINAAKTARLLHLGGTAVLEQLLQARFPAEWPQLMSLISDLADLLRRRQWLTQPERTLLPLLFDALLAGRVSANDIRPIFSLLTEAAQAAIPAAQRPALSDLYAALMRPPAGAATRQLARILSGRLSTAALRRLETALEQPDIAVKPVQTAKNTDSYAEWLQQELAILQAQLRQLHAASPADPDLEQRLQWLLQRHPTLALRLLRQCLIHPPVVAWISRHWQAATHRHWMPALAGAEWPVLQSILLELVSGFEQVPQDRLLLYFREVFYRQPFLRGSAGFDLPKFLSDLIFLLSASEQQSAEMLAQGLYRQPGQEQGLLWQALRPYLRRAPQQPQITEISGEAAIPPDLSLYIENAGLVLLAPYFVRYFDALQLLENRVFKNEEAALRAVHLLQFLASRQTETPEHQLVLNKILCGIPLETPVPPGIELLDTERELALSLLGAILQHWEKMKTSTIDNLSGAFLLRNGRLMENEDHWSLHVENKVYDILLEFVPWGFSMVKLPWMPKRIDVTWKKTS